MNSERGAKKEAFTSLHSSFALFHVYLFQFVPQEEHCKYYFKTLYTQKYLSIQFCSFFPNFLAQLCLRLSLAFLLDSSANVYYSGILQKRVTPDYVKTTWCGCVYVRVCRLPRKERRSIRGRWNGWSIANLQREIISFRYGAASYHVRRLCVLRVANLK